MFLSRPKLGQKKFESLAFYLVDNLSYIFTVSEISCIIYIRVCVCVSTKPPHEVELLD